MAYISQEEKAALAPAIKAVLKKYNMKGSISIRNYSSLVVKIKSGAISLDDYNRYDPIDGTTFKGSDRGYLSFVDFVNDSNVKGELAAFLKELITAMKGAGWYNRSDSMIDYFDIAYYINIELGSYNKDYVCTRQLEAA